MAKKSGKKKNPGTGKTGNKGGEVARPSANIDLKELVQSGVQIDIVTSNKGPTNNNNEKHELKESRTELVDNDVKEEGKCEEKEESDVTADESGFQEANSSQLDKSAASPPGKVLRAQDLNQGFLEPGPASPARPRPKKKVEKKVEVRRGGREEVEVRRGGREEVKGKWRGAAATVLEVARRDLTVEDYLAAGVSKRIVMTKHPLEHTWTFWYQDSRDSKISWEEQVKPVAHVSFIEDFWQVFHHIESVSALQEGQDYSLFKEGICPDWSDFANMRGGRLIVNQNRPEVAHLAKEEARVRRERLEAMWMELLLILVGEGAGKHAHHVNGVTINIKKKQDRLAVWLRSAGDMEAVVAVGGIVKDRLQVSGGQLDRKGVYFQAHDQGPGRKSYSPNKTFI